MHMYIHIHIYILHYTGKEQLYTMQLDCGETSLNTTPVPNEQGTSQKTGSKCQGTSRRLCLLEMTAYTRQHRWQYKHTY